MAFVSMSKKSKKEINHFRYKLIHLFSMMHAVAMASISALHERSYSIIDIDHVPKRYIRVLDQLDQRQKVEIVYQWINTLIIVETGKGLLNVPPPILSRVFQEMEKAMIEYNQVVQIMTLPFPFPYSQVCLFMVFGHMICTPFIMAYYTGQASTAALFTFLSSASFFSLEMIAAELENPFGDDPNDLPSQAFQNEMNEGLLLLLHPAASIYFELPADSAWKDMTTRKTWHSLSEVEEQEDSAVKNHAIFSFDDSEDEDLLEDSPSPTYLRRGPSFSEKQQRPSQSADADELGRPRSKEGRLADEVPADAGLPKKCTLDTGQADSPGKTSGPSSLVISAPVLMPQTKQQLSASTLPPPVPEALQAPVLPEEKQEKQAETVVEAAKSMLAEYAALSEPKWIEKFMRHQDTFEEKLLRSLSGIKEAIENSARRIEEISPSMYGLEGNRLAADSGCCAPRVLAPPVRRA